jgi:diguanylate cyclase (GGDEF)-like protein/PAS domain S-box-containing protein
LSDSQKSRSISRKVPWPLVAVFLLLTAGLSAISWVFYAVQTKHARAFMESELATVAGLKAEQILRWRDEQLAFARALQENRANAEIAKILAGDRAPESARTQFLTGMKGLQKSLPFTQIELVLLGGRILATYPEGPALASTPESTRLGHEAWEAGKPLLGTIVLDEKTGSRSIEMMVPLPEGEDAATTVALLRMSFDAAAEIDPMLDDWPNRRDSAEAILLQIEDGNFVRLSHPRLFEGTTPPPPIPVASFRRPASEKALGEEGLVEGTDYRGRPVIEYLRAVPGTPWLVAVKTDLADLTLGMAARYLILAAVAVALIFICGGLLCVFWRRSLAAQEADERSKWDDANRTMDDLLHQIISVMPNPAFFKDAEGRYRGTNPAFEKLLGLSGKEIIGKTLADVAPEKLVEQHEGHDRDLLARPGHQVYEAPLQASDGEHHVIFIKMAYRRPDGTVGGIIGILKDITQRLRAEEELDQLRKFSDSTVQTMTEGLVLTDSDGKFSFVNPAAARMLGYTPDDLIDREVASFVPKDQHAKLRRVDEERTKGVSGRYELAFQHKDGSRRVFLVSGGPRVQGAEFGGTLAVLTDITERKAMEEEIKALSLHDELTTLLNRRGFLTLAEQQLKTASRLKKRIALLYLDVDDLKRINDTGGHKLGDRALTEVAFNLKKSFRESDIVARMGGDEFSVLAMESTHLDADTLVSRLEEKLAFFNDRSSAEAGFRLAVSIGVFTREPDQQATIEEMLSRADLLMYERKRARKGGSASKPPGPSK